MRHCLTILLTLGLASVASLGGDADGNSSKFEIRKFRFTRHKTKNFERLVIEFTPRDKGRKTPDVKTVASTSGKEANIIIDEASLVGAIPEAIINDSYVAKSEFLGPVSINTDGPNSGFTLRTFLKQPVSVDAFWLARPPRLVLDVFPVNSPRMEGRAVGDAPDREVASTSETATRRGPKDPNAIVCYPLSAAVSAAVSFSQQFNATGGQAPDRMPLSNMASQPEPVVCFMASSQVFPNVAFKPKVSDFNNYVQWEPYRPQQNSLFGAPQQPLMGAPPMPPLPQPPTSMAPPPSPNPANGPQSSAPLPGNPAQKASMIVTDVQPGRTPLGAPLIPPSSVQRLPSNPPPAKLPSSFGEAPPSAGPTKLGNALPPPVK